MRHTDAFASWAIENIMTYPPTHTPLCCMMMIRICLTELLEILGQVSLEARVKHVRTVGSLGWIIPHLHAAQPLSRIATLMKVVMSK
jgi:hypothetical protein